MAMIFCLFDFETNVVNHLFILKLINAHNLCVCNLNELLLIVRLVIGN